MVSREQTEDILSKVALSGLAGTALRRHAMEALDSLQGYDWSGIYRLEGDTLVLDAYVGAETDHTRIPVGRGVCGTAVADNQNQVVVDVRELENYLACSMQTRSEIVVLIRDPEGHILGQIDVDGHKVGAFDQSDEALLERLSDLLAANW